MSDSNPTQIHAKGEAMGFIPAPGVTALVLNPDAHAGYGAPVGCVLTSPTHIYPGPVGVDIKCSMSFLQLDLPDRRTCRRTTRRGRPANPPANTRGFAARSPDAAGEVIFQ